MASIYVGELIGRLGTGVQICVGVMAEGGKR